MTQIPASFAVGGGLDLVSAALTIPQGRLRSALNYEAVPTGYARLAGYERFDGRAKPSEAVAFVLGFGAGATAIVAGNILTGATSGATARVLLDVVPDSGSWADDDAAGQVFIVPQTGTFTVGEDLQVSASTVAELSALPVPASEDDPSYRAATIAAQQLRRTLIAAVPGSGPVRGIGDLGGQLYAFRDNVGATAGTLWKATASGWTAVALGRELNFTSGLVEISEGQTVLGATSGATAVVRRIVKMSGNWGSNAAGYMVFTSQTGTFVAETLKVGATNVATIGGNSTAIALPAGGTYRCKAHNFYGASNLRRMYGVNGVGRGFEFDGTVFCPIRTGMVADAPNHLATFQQHLFFSFPGGSVQHSAPGTPLIWDLVLGAEEMGMGADVTDMIENTSTALAIFTLESVGILTGTNQDDFVLTTLTDDAGAVAGASGGTAQNVGKVVYMDMRGLRSLVATQAFGNFGAGLLSQLVQPYFNARIGTAPAGSMACKSKSQYRLFWPDGTGLYVHMAPKDPEFTPVDLAIAITCTHRCEIAGREVLLVGSDDGFVYQLDSGTSFDGEPVEGFIQLPNNALGTPQIEKRFHSVDVGVISEEPSEFGVVVDFGGDAENAPTALIPMTAVGAAGLWDASLWDSFFWSVPADGIISAPIDGLGTRAALIVASRGDALTPPHTLQTYTLFTSKRRLVRR